MKWKKHGEKYIKQHEYSPEQEYPINDNKLYSCQNHKLFSFYFAFEDGTYCEDEFINLVDKAIVDYALSPDEQVSMDHVDAWKRMVKYKEIATKNGARYITGGMYGEVLLFTLLGIFFPGVGKMSTKIKIRTAVNSEIHGFDCAHYEIREDGGIVLWLGEAKFYNNYSTAIEQAVKSIKEHIQAVKLKEEFLILMPHLEGDDTNLLKKEMDEKMLDDIHLICPVLITYDSDIPEKHRTDSQQFKDEIAQEFQKIWEKYLGCKVDPGIRKIDIFLMAVPFKQIAEIKKKLKSRRDSYS